MDRGEMNQLSTDLREDLLEVLDEVSTLMSAEYAQLGPLPDDHPLAQSGLENRAEIGHELPVANERTEIVRAAPKSYYHRILTDGV
jgi:hypothetical protein